MSMSWPFLPQKIQRSLWWICCCMGWMVLCGSTSGWAADVDQAVNAYKKGYAAFANTEYTLAVQWFRIAQKELPKLERYERTRVELDRLIGLSLYHLREFKAAYPLLDSYLRSPFRRKAKVVEVQKTWLELRSRLGLTTSDTTPPVERRVVPVPERRVEPVPNRPPVGVGVPVIPPKRPPVSRRPHTGAWTVTALGLATLGVAVVIGVVAQQSMNGVQERYDRLVSLPDRSAQAISQGTRDATAQSTAANILYIGGGTLTLTGVVLLFTWSAPPGT